MTDFVRARNCRQKEERMKEIKKAAEKQFHKNNYPEITLSTIAGELSWSRANLYKYVTSKEEIFLELSADKCAEYFSALYAAFPEGCGYSKEVIAEVWAGILNAKSDYLKYSALLSSIIETNVTVERLSLFKKQFHDQLDLFTELFSANFHVPVEKVYWLFLSVQYQATGLYSYCNASPLITEALRLAQIPLSKPDFRKMMKEFIYMSLENM